VILEEWMRRDIRRLQPINAAMSLRVGIRVGLIPLCLTLFGCTIQSGLPGPNVIFNTPMGSVPLNSPASVPPGGALAVPPANLEPPLPVPTQPVSRDGTYSGTAEVLSTNGGSCTRGMNVSNFRVHGNSVRFGLFRGTIASDGGLQMVFRGTWIIGQFEGATFRGQVDDRGGRNSAGCTFILTLDRTGP
jgi:hypothetical protein